MAFNSDNCSVMKGQSNGVIAKIREVAPRVHDIGCICHLANLAVGSALKKSYVDVDGLLCSKVTHFSNKSVLFYSIISNIAQRNHHM